ncbi:SET and MYND domain-containing protein 4 [Diachasma alloeum]|uniref:SET and MYND domain-containing protein 4 n=1 Tax=Diachasma alloeum TaxID=454923 RepID=UPI00073827F4|nr:SET and MYND domain-containing protein 4 [Diachasma alloeum]
MDKIRGWTSDFDFESMKKTIDMDSLPHLTDEDRFKTVMNSMRIHKGFRSWMSRLQSPRSTKNAKQSKFYREKANDLYLSNPQGSVRVILEGFTVSLAYAPQSSPEMALAYANRSAILLKVHHYEDALLDIGRAFKSGYPDRLKSKLFARRALCLKALRPEDSSEVDRALENARKWLRRMDKRHPHRRMIEDILSNPRRMENLPRPRAKWNSEVFLRNVFEENPEIVGASSSIQLRHSESGVHLEATRDIKPGEIIAIQEPFVAAVERTKAYSYCAHCFLEALSGVPCWSCANRVYCSEGCRETAWRDYHEVECGFIEMIQAKGIHSDNLRVMIVRAVIKAVKEAGSLQALRERVRRMEKDPDLWKKGFSGSVFDGRTLETFFSLPTHAAARDPEFLLIASFMSVFTTFVLATKSKFFGEEMNVQRFLQNEWVPFVGGLVMKFTLIMMGGAQDICTCIDFRRQFECGSTFVPLYVRFPHSCSPNISHRNFGRKTVVFAHYPVKKGERLIGCLGCRFETALKKNRQKALKMIIGGPCQCIACKEDWIDSEKSSFDAMQVPPHVWAIYEAFDDNSDDCFELIRQGNYAVISKTLHELARTMTEVWKMRKPPCPVLSNLSAFIYRFFSLLGNHHQVLEF